MFSGNRPGDCQVTAVHLLSDPRDLFPLYPSLVVLYLDVYFLACLIRPFEFDLRQSFVAVITENMDPNKVDALHLFWCAIHDPNFQKCSIRFSQTEPMNSRYQEWIGWKRIGETFRRKLDSCEFNSTTVPYLCYGRYKHGLVSDRFDALILCRVLCFRFGVSEEWVVERLFRAQRSIFTSPEWLLSHVVTLQPRFFSIS